MASSEVMEMYEAKVVEIHNLKQAAEMASQIVAMLFLAHSVEGLVTIPEDIVKQAQTGQIPIAVQLDPETGEVTLEIQEA